MADQLPSHPVTLSIDYPDRNLNRLTTALRLFAAIPILIVLCLLVGAACQWGGKAPAMGGILVAPVLLMILFRQKYPRWWFDWNVALTNFSLRVGAYLLLLTDVYPSTDEEQCVHLTIPYPDAEKDLVRWMPLVKWFLAIPHYIVLVLLGIAAVVAVVIAWFAIIFTARYPRSIFDFVVGVKRWGLRVSAYAFLLTTDVYPPFSLT